jgi:hypothetical protein
MGTSGQLDFLALDDAYAIAYVEASMARMPTWQMEPAAPATKVERKDPQLLGILASAENAALGELELDVFAWIVTAWFVTGRPADGQVKASYSQIARALYGKAEGGRQYELIDQALRRLRKVILSLSVLEFVGDQEVWEEREDLNVLHQLKTRRRLRGGEDPTVGRITLALDGWLVQQLDAQTVVALAWQVIRKLSGRSKRLALYLAAHASAFAPITQHTERLEIELCTAFYEELGISAARERDRRGSVTRAASRIAEHDPRYNRLDVVKIKNGKYVLRADRPTGGAVLPLPARTR